MENKFKMKLKKISEKNTRKMKAHTYASQLNLEREKNQTKFSKKKE